ncbi:MAG: Holliday junction branch migration DNA helicase RuvB [Spirochaetota bacterium]|nr:Holliday junction branch migration DNA helicase RuvB [Spirochaetota bacterium]
MIEENIINPHHQVVDVEDTLRPQRLHEFVGQSKIKENISIYIEAARKRNQAMDHVLLYGPPGLGKTTLSHIIATELEAPIKITSAPTLDKQGDLMAILTSLQEGEVLFIDEIHRLKKTLEEILYSAMEDFKVDIIIGEGTGAKTLSFSIPRFTLIGATTRAGSLSAPLRSRFGIIERMEFYNEQELSDVIKRSAKILQVNINDSGAQALACRSRGTPRIANRLLRRISDFALVANISEAHSEFIDQTLQKLEIDHEGLDSVDRKLLQIIIEFYQGGPVGISALAATLNEEIETLEDVIEPYLIQKGYIQRTPRGRVASFRAYEHLGIKSQQRDNDTTLFHNN